MRRVKKPFQNNFEIQLMNSNPIQNDPNFKFTHCHFGVLPPPPQELHLGHSVRLMWAHPPWRTSKFSHQTQTIKWIPKCWMVGRVIPPSRCAKSTLEPSSLAPDLSKYISNLAVGHSINSDTFQGDIEDYLGISILEKTFFL